MDDQGKKTRRKRGAGAEAGVVDPSRAPTVLIAFRAPPALAERLDKLAAELSTSWHEMKRSELSRVALERGLAAMELEEAARQRGG